MRTALVRGLLIALALLCAHRAGAAIAVGVHASASTTAASVITTASVTSAASGSTFVIFAATTGTFAATAVDDNKSNVYTTIQTWVSTWGGVTLLRASISGGAGGAGHTFSAHATASTLIAVIAYEVTGATSSGSIDKSAKGNDAATPFDSPNTATLAQANELFLGFAADNSASGTCTYTAGNSFTLQEVITNASGITMASSWKVVSVTTGDHSDFTDAGCGATQMDVSIDTFKQAAAATAACNNALIGVGC